MVQLVRQSPPADPDALMAWDQEPIFWIHQQRHLKLPESAPPQQVAQYLAHRIARNPADLRSHTQRILLHIRYHESERVYGALLDLFIALGSWGLEIRGRLLRCAERLLSQSVYSALRQHLESGVRPTDCLPTTPWSVLSKGITGSEPLVRAILREQREQTTALQEARELIVSGQITEAQRMLEQALLADPDDEELGLELLELYQHNRDMHALETMRRRLSERSERTAQAWAAMAELFTLE
jgi:hypothetical protein